MKRDVRRVVGILLAAVLAGCGGGSEDKSYTVSYEINGSYGAKALVTYSAGDSIQQKDVTLPGSVLVFAKEGDFLQVSAQNPGASGFISVRIEVDGKEVRSATSTARYGIASTNYRCCD